MRKNLKIIILLTLLVPGAQNCHNAFAQQMAEGTLVELVNTINSDFHITASVISPYAKHVAIGGKAEAYLLHDFRTGMKPGRDLVEDEATVTCLAFSWDNTMLAIGDSQGYIRVWNIDNEELLIETDGTLVTNGQDELRAGHKDWGEVTALAWDQDDDTLVVGLGDGTIPVIGVRPEQTRGNRPFTQEEENFMPGPISKPGLGENGILTRKAPMTSLEVIQDNIRGVGSRPRQGGQQPEQAPQPGQTPAEQASPITNFFTVDGNCVADSCFEFTRPGRYLTSLKFPGWDVAYLVPGTTELNIYTAINRASMEKPKIAIFLPPNQKTLPQFVNKLDALPNLTAEDLNVFDIAFRPRSKAGQQILTLSPRLASLWSADKGTYLYAHVPEAPIVKGGFESHGDYLYLISKNEGNAAPAGENGGAPIVEHMRVYYLRDKPK